MKKQGIELSEDKMPLRHEYNSLFRYYIYTDRYQKRTYIPNTMLECNMLRVRVGDMWTRGIFYELFGLFIKENNGWGEILELPEQYKDYAVF